MIRLHRTCVAHRARSLRGLGLLFALACAACSNGGPDGWLAPEPPTSQFSREVYPVLIRDCGFQTCHGSEERFFRVWGPGRTRLEPLSTGAFDAFTPAEMNASYERAVSFVDANDPKRSLLLRKPLATEAGGMGHLGVDKFGRNLYRSTDSPGYLILSRWVYSTPKQ